MCVGDREIEKNRDIQRERETKRDIVSNGILIRLLKQGTMQISITE